MGNYGGNGVVMKQSGESFQNMNNAPMLDLSGKMNIALVLLAILVVMCGYVCFKK